MPLFLFSRCIIDFTVKRKYFPTSNVMFIMNFATFQYTPLYTHTIAPSYVNLTGGFLVTLKRDARHVNANLIRVSDLIKKYHRSFVSSSRSLIRASSTHSKTNRRRRWVSMSALPSRQVREVGFQWMRTNVMRRRNLLPILFHYNRYETFFLRIERRWFRFLVRVWSFFFFSVSMNKKVDGRYLWL